MSRLPAPLTDARALAFAAGEPVKNLAE